jgi:hypothetical protein
MQCHFGSYICNDTMITHEFFTDQLRGLILRIVVVLSRGTFLQVSMLASHEDGYKWMIQPTDL